MLDTSSFRRTFVVTIWSQKLFNRVKQGYILLEIEFLKLSIFSTWLSLKIQH